MANFAGTCTSDNKGLLLLLLLLMPEMVWSVICGLCFRESKSSKVQSIWLLVCSMNEQPKYSIPTVLSIVECGAGFAVCCDCDSHI